MKRSSKAILAGLIALIAVQFYFLFKTTVVAGKGVTYELKHGTSKQTLLFELYQTGIIAHPVFYSLFVLPQNAAKLKRGEYLFPKGSSFFSIWRQLATGRGQIFQIFTIIPGWTFADVKKSLAEASWVKHETTLMTDKQLMARIGYPDLLPEGEFFPETYFFTRGASDVAVLKRAFKLMQKRLTAAWENRAPNLPYQNKYEALIAASLVEKEAYLKTERPMIAGVLVNRLRKNMLLQFDPTIIYGLGERYTGKILKEDLKEDSPYNTYLHKGLPPTPIAMPSMSSIDAALHPEQHDYYYFVAKGDGAHQFSKSLVEHNAAVKAVKPQAYFNNDQFRHLFYVMLQTNYSLALNESEIICHVAN